ncbi:hypothetical protein LSUE1_G005407 [Lachnellula suecica]|uniref:Aminoglycoside phosphotransferase domain-containing protein n=1 Tax=Lachnellula suecica TaxID=602035 RepID=A0A8T9C9U5_9HELO|nr:hypothetical protein LSUE1_G005407 [Lachnellula suecica]
MPHAPVSILMARMPGSEIGQTLIPKAKRTALAKLNLFLSTIRGWKRPRGNEEVCSITGGAIRSVRVPRQTIAPCATPEEFHDYLLSAAWNSCDSEDVYENRLRTARKLQELQRPGVKFAHRDFEHHDILVDDEGYFHITGLIDWYPKFWEHTTALRFLQKDYWWYDCLMKLGGEQYLEESDCERALTNLTADSLSW